MGGIVGRTDFLRVSYKQQDFQMQPKAHSGPR